MAQFKSRCRVLWHQACELHQTRPTSKHRLLAWCVQYAGQLVTRTNKFEDGRTSWSTVTGRAEFPRPLVPWGEKVMFIEGGGKMKPAGPEPKWSEGIILALVDKSNEYIIGTPRGCIRSTATAPPVGPLRRLAALFSNSPCLGGRRFRQERVGCKSVLECCGRSEPPTGRRALL